MTSFNGSRFFFTFYSFDCKNVQGFQPTLSCVQMCVCHNFFANKYFETKKCEKSKKNFNLKVPFHFCQNFLSPFLQSTPNRATFNFLFQNFIENELKSYAFVNFIWLQLCCVYLSNVCVFFSQNFSILNFPVLFTVLRLAIYVPKIWKMLVCPFGSELSHAQNGISVDNDCFVNSFYKFFNWNLTENLSELCGSRKQPISLRRQSLSTIIIFLWLLASK